MDNKPDNIIPPYIRVAVDLYEMNNKPITSDLIGEYMRLADIRESLTNFQRMQRNARAMGLEYTDADYRRYLSVQIEDLVRELSEHEMASAPATPTIPLKGNK